MPCACYMTFHSVVPPPRTILTGVRKLPPATIRVVEPDGRFRDETYWEPAFDRDPTLATWDERDWQDALMDTLRTAVERRMVADVPVGVLLSGGIDSSLVVALLAEAGQHGLKTFSVGFESAGGEAGDEFEYSDIVAKHFETDHRQIMIEGSRLLPAISGAVAAMSEPMVSHDCVAFYLLSEEVVPGRQGRPKRSGRRRGARRLRLVPTVGRGVPERSRRGLCRPSSSIARSRH